MKKYCLGNSLNKFIAFCMCCAPQPDITLPEIEIINCELTCFILFYLKVNINFNVQISDIFSIWFQLEHSIDLLPLGACEVVLQIEHNLLPVRVWSLWGRGETHSFVTMSKLDVEECHQSLDVVIPPNLQMERRLERYVFLFHCLDINFLD